MNRKFVLESALVNGPGEVYAEIDNVGNVRFVQAAGYGSAQDVIQLTPVQVKTFVEELAKP